jgi:hypothetical protein
MMAARTTKMNSENLMAISSANNEQLETQLCNDKFD